MPRKQSPETQVRHLKGVVRRQDTRIVGLMSELNERRRIGAMLSNICYNGKGRADMPEDFRRSMADAQVAWDGINKI